MGDNGVWAARIGQGYDTLVKHAIEGIRDMPAKGGNPDLDDVEVARAVVYMANKSGASFKAPAAPAAAPAAAAMPLAAAPAPTPVSNAAAAAAPSTESKNSVDAGKKVYDATCVACHGQGIAGAPKFGDKATWGPRVAQGKPTLSEHAAQGWLGRAGRGHQGRRRVHGRRR